MGRNEYRELGGICGYAKVKYKERVEIKRRKRSFSEPTVKDNIYGKLHKPPTVQSLHERPRNRLQKRALTASQHPSPTLLSILEYEPYPYNTQPSKFLGVYSTIDSVTLAAFNHGAYTFSKEGLLDGSEYLSPTGRIKISSYAIETSGIAAALPESNECLDGEPVRLDIPHPEIQEESTRHMEVKEEVFLAVHEGPQMASCIGVFTKKSIAWGACLKNKASYIMSSTLIEEERSIGANNMPQTTARLIGSGRHAWFVRSHEVDSLDR